MYKLLIFLHKSENDEVFSHFNEYTVKYLSDLTGQDAKIGKVESNLLLDVKYGRFCEITVDSKETWDKLMNSPKGRQLNKDLMDFHQSITLIFVEYDN